jgi:aspartate-semialdehyde dehydrogenase
MSAKVVAVAGVTGAVGTEMLRVLEARKFPVKKLVPLASARSVGKKITFAGEEVVVGELSDDSFEGVDIALFSAGGSRSKKFAPAAVASGAVVIDNSSAFRMDPDVPLVVPEVNAEAAKTHRGIIANPNCTTIMMAVPMWPIHKAVGVTRIISCSYQAVSGTGAKAISELCSQASALVAGEDHPQYKEAALLAGLGVREDTPHVAHELERTIYPHQIAFNCLPHIGGFYPEGDTEEERKLVNETHKIFADDSIAIFGTTVRVPVFRAHCEAIHFQTAKPISPDEVRELLFNAPGVEVTDDPAKDLYPMPIYATGRAEVLVGRIRRDPSVENGMALFLAGDQLLKGAALNAVQIAELL